MTGKGQYGKYRDHRRHILDRPDTALGSIKKKPFTTFVLNHDDNIGNHIKEELIMEFNPGLERIFIEMISNAHDNAIKSSTSETPTKNINVRVNVEEGYIMVYNDGLGIRQIEVIDEDGERIEGSIAPEVIFGELLSGSNFDDSVVRNTSGRNGYGAKLANIFSKKFIVEAYDEKSGKIFSETWYDNMERKSGYTLKSGSGKSGWTRITFWPDLKRFGYEKLPEEMVMYFYKLVADIAMQQPKTKVTFNDKVIYSKSLKEYAQMYVGTKAPIMEFSSKDSEVVVVDCSSMIDKEEDDKLSPDEEDGYDELRESMSGRNISFVNGIYVHDGGIHVDTWVKTICEPLMERISVSLKLIKSKKVNEKGKEKEKGKAPNWKKIRIDEVKRRLAFFIVCHLDKPSFDSQTKLKLNSPAPQVTAPNATQLTKMSKWNLRAHIKLDIRARTLAGQKKTDATQTSWRNAEKHQRANWFKTKKSDQTILILTEGDSAKGTASAAIPVLEGGNNIYGLYPLRGKLLNTRRASVEQINKNTEICDLKNIIGLKHGTDYSDEKNFKSLNYGGVQIWTDQDLDGDHIKGLILNWFEENYPSLIQRGYITAMNTPIGIVKHKGKVLYFYELNKLRTWYQSLENKNGVEIKYIKGLGTLDEREIQEIVSIDNKVIGYSHDGEKDSQAMSLAFSKTNANERKKWILAYDPSEVIDPADYDQISLSTFINLGMRSYSVETLRRSIPSVLDSFKEGQRKIFYTGIRKNINKPVKVVQFAGDVMKHSAYHHGEKALTDTITGMAQCWAGRNNTPFLIDSGNFGCRKAGSSSAGAPRYISTCVSDLAHLLYPKEDYPLHKYLLDDGVHIEPEHYMPILPTVLFNNPKGIATGWNSEVPSFNPFDVIKWVRAFMKGLVNEDNLFLPDGQLVPWYIGFKGKVELLPPNEKIGLDYSTSFTVSGLTRSERGQLIITEIPPNITFDDYMIFLNKLEASKKIRRFTHDCTTGKPYFVLHLNENKLSETSLKLHQKNTFAKMVLLDENGLPRRFKCAEEILNYWCKIRTKLYKIRRTYMLNVIRNGMKWIKNMIRLIEEITEGTIILTGKTSKKLIEELDLKNYDKKEDSYDYLVKMPITSLNTDKLEKLRETLDREIIRYKDLKALSIFDIWESDLQKFEKFYPQFLDKIESRQTMKFKPTKKKSKK